MTKHIKSMNENLRISSRKQSNQLNKQMENTRAIRRRSSQRRQSHSSHNRPRVLQNVFIGIEVNYEKCKYWLYTDDGNYSLDFYVRQVQVKDMRNELLTLLVHDDIICWLESWTVAENVKLLAAGLSMCEGESESICNGKLGELASRIWFELDALPFLVRTRGLAEDERTCSAVRKLVAWLTGTASVPIPRITVGYLNEVH
jgi:hypothetical protein